MAYEAFVIWVITIPTISNEVVNHADKCQLYNNTCKPVDSQWLDCCEKFTRNETLCEIAHPAFCPDDCTCTVATTTTGMPTSRKATKLPATATQELITYAGSSSNCCKRIIVLLALTICTAKTINLL